jgi:hypothetical protein
MRKKLNQLTFFLVLVGINLIYYAVIPFCYEIMNTLNTNMTNASAHLDCNFKDYNAQLIASYMDMTMRDILPFTLIFFFSILLIMSIFRARRRVKGTTSDQARRLVRDIRFSVMTLLMNFFLIILSLPFSIILLVPNYKQDLAFDILFYLFYFSYGVNFYVMLITNSLFRNEVISLLRLRKQKKTF